MLKTVTASTTISDGAEAARVLIDQCHEKLDIYAPKIGIICDSHKPDDARSMELLQNLSNAFPYTTFVGSTVMAGFTEDSGYQKEGYFLCLLVSDTISVEAGIVSNLSSLQESGKIGVQFQKELSRSGMIGDKLESIKLCMIFPEYFQISGDQLTDELQDILPNDCTLFGGFATDYWTDEQIKTFPESVVNFKTTKQYFIKNKEILITSNAMPYLLFSGPVEITGNYTYGWSDTGQTYSIKTNGNIIREIDGMEAHAFLVKENHPLVLSNNYISTEFTLWVHRSGKKPYLRDIFIEKENGKNIIHTNHEQIPDGAKVSFAFPNKKHVSKEFANTMLSLQGQYDAVFTITCCSHIPLLEESVENEYLYHKTAFSDSAFYCSYVFGEFGPTAIGQKSSLHSCSSICLCLREERDLKRTESVKEDFLLQTILKQNEEIQSLQKQLSFFEKNSNNKKTTLNGDCLGIFLNNSHRSITAHAEQLSKIFKEHYNLSGKKQPYPISRNRIIDHLKEVKEHSRVFLSNKKSE